MLRFALPHARATGTSRSSGRAAPQPPCATSRPRLPPTHGQHGGLGGPPSGRAGAALRHPPRRRRRRWRHRRHSWSSRPARRPTRLRPGRRPRRLRSGCLPWHLHIRPPREGSTSARRPQSVLDSGVVGAHRFAAPPRRDPIEWDSGGVGTAICGRQCQPRRTGREERGARQPPDDHLCDRGVHVRDVVAAERAGVLAALHMAGGKDGQGVRLKLTRSSSSSFQTTRQDRPAVTSFARYLVASESDDAPPSRTTGDGQELFGNEQGEDLADRLRAAPSSALAHFDERPHLALRRERPSAKDGRRRGAVDAPARGHREGQSGEDRHARRPCLAERLGRQIEHACSGELRSQRERRDCRG